MGIYIKGMEMPKDCRECKMRTYYFTSGCSLCDISGNTLARNFKPIAFDGRPNDCPLVEIPEPHGRLIDADAYCKDLLEEAHRVWGLLKPETIERINRTVDDLKNYPAVVEAEGSENHDD